MTPAEFWWLIGARQPVKTWGRKWVHTEAQMKAQYDEMLVEHEKIYGRE